MQSAIDKVTTGFGGFTTFMQHLTDVVVNAVSSLANTAGYLLQQLWEILTRQQLILGLQEMLIGIFMLIAAVISYRFSSRLIKNKKFDTLDKSVLLIVAGLIIVWLSVNGVQHAIDSLPRLLNPQYYALQDSVRLLQQIKPN